MKARWFCFLGLTAFWMHPANAESVRAQDPGTLVRALQQAGYVAELGDDMVGDPKISSVVAGTTFQIFFYNCTNHANCATVQFHSGYDLRVPITLELLNQHNQEQRFARAYLDKEDDPILAMDIDLDDGGISPALFVDNLEFWATVLQDFERRIGYRK